MTLPAFRPKGANQELSEEQRADREANDSTGEGHGQRPLGANEQSDE